MPLTPKPLLPMYSIADEMANTYYQPFFSANDATAKRYFKDGLHSDPSMYMNRRDFHLYHVGYFDPSTGDLVDDLRHLSPGTDSYYDHPSDSRLSTDTPEGVV